MLWLDLQRTREHRDGTPGALHVPGLDPMLHTIERHWEGNARMISRIPAGEYKLVWHGSAKFPVSWAMIGGTLAHFETEADADDSRFACLIHPANWAYQLNGCIAPGLRHLTMAARGRAAELAVAASRRAIDRIHGVIGDGTGYGIRIIDPIN